MHRLTDAAFAVVTHFDAIDDDLNIMGLVTVEHHAELDLAHLSIDAHTGKPRLADMLKQLTVVAFSPSDRRRQDIDATPHVVVHDEVSDLLLGVAHHLLTRVVGIGFADAGIEQTQEVVDLGDGAHGGARVLVDRFLLDADHGAQSGDLIDIGAFHVADELSGVGRETLHVTTLAFGIDGVERQRRFATAADAGDHHQGIAWNGKVDVSQVVFPGTENL